MEHLCDGYAERSISVQDRDTDLDLFDLTVEVPRHEALPEQFHAVHPLPDSGLAANHERVALDVASTEVATPIPPKRAAQVFRCAQSIVSGDCTRGIRFPRLGVFFCAAG